MLLYSDSRTQNVNHGSVNKMSESAGKLRDHPNASNDIQTEFFGRAESGFSVLEGPFPPHLDVGLDDIQDYFSEADCDTLWGGRDETLSATKTTKTAQRASKWTVVSNLLGFISTVSAGNVSHILELPCLHIPANERTQDDLKHMYEKLKASSLFLKLGFNLANNSKAGLRLMSQIHFRTFEPKQQIFAEGHSCLLSKLLPCAYSFFAGDSPDGVYVVLSGKISLSKRQAVSADAHSALDLRPVHPEPYQETVLIQTIVGTGILGDSVSFKPRFPNWKLICFRTKQYLTPYLPRISWLKLAHPQQWWRKAHQRYLLTESIISDASSSMLGMYVFAVGLWIS